MLLADSYFDQFRVVPWFGAYSSNIGTYTHTRTSKLFCMCFLQSGLNLNS